MLLRPLNCAGNLDLGDETLETLHPTIRALIPPMSSDETPAPELDSLNDLRRDVLESLLLLTRSAVGEKEMTSTRNILPLMEVRSLSLCRCLPRSLPLSRTYIFSRTLASHTTRQSSRST